MAAFPSTEMGSNRLHYLYEVLLKHSVALVFSDHLVLHRRGMSGINFLLKTDSRKNVIMSFMVPTVLRISNVQIIYDQI